MQKQVKGSKKGKKEKPGSEEASRKKTWNLSNGRSQAITKALRSIWEKNPRFQGAAGA